MSNHVKPKGMNLDKQGEIKIYKNGIKKISLDDEESSDIDS